MLQLWRQTLRPSLQGVGQGLTIHVSSLQGWHLFDEQGANCGSPNSDYQAFLQRLRLADNKRWCISGFGIIWGFNFSAKARGQKTIIGCRSDL